MGDADYEALQKALDFHNDAVKQYENDCAAFTRDVRSRLARQLGCSEKNVKPIRWAQADEDDPSENLVRRTIGRFMWLDTDAFWHFGFKIFFKDDWEWVTIQLSAKKIEDIFVARYGEVEIDATTDEQRDELVQHIIKIAVDWLMTSQDDFVRGRPQKKPPLGFPTDKAKRS